VEHSEIQAMTANARNFINFYDYKPKPNWRNEGLLYDKSKDSEAMQQLLVIIQSDDFEIVRDRGTVSIILEQLTLTYQKLNRFKQAIL
jgi:hypothetical protein